MCQAGLASRCLQCRLTRVSLGYQRSISDILSGRALETRWMLRCYGAQHGTASRITVVLQGHSWMCSLRTCVTRLPFTCFVCRNKPCVAQLTVRPFAAVVTAKERYCWLDAIHRSTTSWLSANIDSGRPVATIRAAEHRQRADVAVDVAQGPSKRAVQRISLSSRLQLTCAWFLELLASGLRRTWHAWFLPQPGPQAGVLTD